MAKNYKKEVNSIIQYLRDGKEEQNRNLVYPLFEALFPKDYTIENDDSDIYIPATLLVEIKTHYTSFLDGFFQGLHYAKKGLSFPSLCVITREFIGLWKKSDIPDFAIKLSKEADAQLSASSIGRNIAKSVSDGERNEILQSATFKIIPSEFRNLRDDEHERIILEFIEQIKTLDKGRIQINERNFISHIALLKRYFKEPMDAIHCFYSIVDLWDKSSGVTKLGQIPVVTSVEKDKTSDPIGILPPQYQDFKKFIEDRYIYVSDKITVDYYFSRFDEVMSEIDREYVLHHGIVFTDNNLSRFALWFVHHEFDNRLSDKYIVFDPAGGSGNLVSSWKGKLKYKIISELQEDLLKTIDRRLRINPDKEGFSIIPSIESNVGLNFISNSAEDYMATIVSALKLEHRKLNLPIAFLLNPPYRNTDENEKYLLETKTQYRAHESIIELTGDDAGRERYVAFLAQILNISKMQMGDTDISVMDFQQLKLPEQLDPNIIYAPIILIFTPTSWLIPNKTYKPFRKEFDKYFKYEKGFIITSKEFFKDTGRFPVAFTIWSYNKNENGNDNKVVLKNLTHLTKNDLNINWDAKSDVLDSILYPMLQNADNTVLDDSRTEINATLPTIYSTRQKGNVIQPRYDYSHAKKEKDFNKIVSGFPKDAKKLHFELKRTCGNPTGEFVGFYDDNTPVRLTQDTCSRMSQDPNRIWFRLDNDFKGINKTRLLNGAPDKYGYCAYDLDSAKATLSWFAITKSMNGQYPTWANQFKIWIPEIPTKKKDYYYALCFAFALVENRCVVTQFEKNNPVDGAPELFIDNPMSPNNPDSFWSTVLSAHVDKKHTEAYKLTQSIVKMYNLWSKKYCQNRIDAYELKDETYFKYFNYAPFLTNNSGLIQIEMFAKANNLSDILDCINDIKQNRTLVLTAIRDFLVEDCKYFEDKK